MSFVLNLQSASAAASDEPNTPISTISVGVVCVASTISASGCATTSTLSGVLC